MSASVPLPILVKVPLPPTAPLQVRFLPLLSIVVVTPGLMFKLLAKPRPGAPA